jgi:GT2 family glycosyltransferase
LLNQVLDAELLRGWFPNSSLWGNAALFGGGMAPVEVEAVSGACMMIRREIFASVGGFSPDYFMYGEDLDLCFKTRRAGFRNYHVSEATIIHHGGGSSQQTHSSFSFVMMRESVSRLLRKSQGGFYSNCYRLALIGTAIGRLILLGMVIPFCLVGGRAHRGVAAFRKWLAIIRWGVGLEQWARQYDVVAPSADD